MRWTVRSLLGDTVCDAATRPIIAPCRGNIHTCVNSRLKWNAHNFCWFIFIHDINSLKNDSLQYISLLLNDPNEGTVPLRRVLTPGSVLYAVEVQDQTCSLVTGWKRHRCGVSAQRGWGRPDERGWGGEGEWQLKEWILLYRQVSVVVWKVC